MNQTVSCPHCQRQLTIPSELVGVTVSCPLCNGNFSIPSSPATSENTPFDFLQSKPSNFSSSPPAYEQKKKRRKQPWELYIGGGITVFILICCVGWMMVTPKSPADKWKEKYDKDFKETVEYTNKLEKESHELTKNVALLGGKIKAQKKWIDEFASATAEQFGFEAVKRLQKLGLILKMDYEARNAIIDHDGWQILSEIEEGRLLLTCKIADAMATRNFDKEKVTGIYEVTLFDSLTGQSLSYSNEYRKITIFR